MTVETHIRLFSTDEISSLGSGLSRPECVLATPSGDLFTPDWMLGIARIAPDGGVSAAVEAPLIEEGFLPNGVAIAPEGGFLFANLGEKGGVWHVGSTGRAQPFLLEVGEYRIPPANFVLVDGRRIWITVSASTRSHEYFTKDEDSGVIILFEGGRARIVADGLTWTNELRVSPDGRHLFVNETFACRTTRFDLEADGSLGARTHVEFPAGTFPDGLAFDETGCLWTVCPVSNRILRIAPDLSWEIVFEDCDPAFFNQMSEAYSKGRLTRDMIVQSKGSRVSNLSSIAFGGRDRKTIYLGALTTASISCLPAPVAGAALDHWA